MTTPIEAKSINGLLIKHVIKDASSKEKASKALSDWQLAKCTPEKWAKQLEYGYILCVGNFEPNPDGKYSHAKDLWQSTHMIFADGDNFTSEKDATETAITPWIDPDELFKRFPSIKSKAYAIAESVSSMSTEKPHRRYRPIFLFDEPITTEKDYHHVGRVLAHEFPFIPNIDRSPAQPVYGNARKENGQVHILGNVLSLKKYLSYQIPTTSPQTSLNGSEIPQTGSPKPYSETRPLPSEKSLTLDAFISEHRIATIKPRSKGGHFVRCPWASNHASGKNSDTDAYIWENPDGTFAFYCSHATCKTRGNSWATYREAVAPKKQKNTKESKSTQRIDISALKQGLSAKTLEQKEFPEMKWVVDDLLPEGLTILAGAPKIGKSYLCWNLALAVSQKGIFLSRYNISHQKDVLYFALEDPERQIKNRLLQIQPDASLPEELFIYTRFPIHLSEEALDTWESTIKQHNAKLVIIDTMHHVLPQNNNGTAYQQDYSILLPIQQMVHRLGISMILVTHTRKMIDVENPFNMIQGSVGVQAACDTMMMLTTVESEKVLHINGREILETELAVEIKNGVFTSESKDDREERNLSDIRGNIINMVKTAGEDGITMKLILDSTEGHSETNVKNTARRMLQDEQIYQPKKRGKYFYKLPDEFSTETDDIPL